ncbi:ribosomal RNA small subunit methyltransferase A [Paenibacillus allorhizosphaerae]|uniref:rRNA adenine N-6-methyltransferase n=1 Tax=Paenibacillus allorhizosphaerae TaxID=2849866 RepID=A0ABM8VKD4_9BACL|nr:rRNA adenine dimethyltransferase family protein [Paenibacillus allorhizosphaerae]CAG7646846.1 rRNA adenine N-6-methyltransferase [Paenibacillus allorhizosphaerae]
MSKNKETHRGTFGVSPNFSAQHLLINKRLIHDLIDLANIMPCDTVLDIGAGAGAITFPLAEKAATVLAIENDPVYVTKLASKLREGTNIRIKPVDFLRLDLPGKPFSVVSNIPYSITTPILGKLLDQPTVPLQRAVLVIEHGAAKRFTASPITDPRILKWRMWFDIRIVCTVSPDHFSPRPRVNSAVVAISRKKNPAVPPQHHAKFAALAAYGLSRPQLPFFAALADIFSAPQMARLVKALGIERTQPIGALREQQWGTLLLAMLQHVEPHRWPKMPKMAKNVTRKKKRR